MPESSKIAWNPHMSLPETSYGMLGRNRRGTMKCKPEGSISKLVSSCGSTTHRGRKADVRSWTVNGWDLAGSLRDSVRLCTGSSCHQEEGRSACITIGWCSTGVRPTRGTLDAAPPPSHAPHNDSLTPLDPQGTGLILALFPPQAPENPHGSCTSERLCWLPPERGTFKGGVV